MDGRPNVYCLSVLVSGDGVDKLLAVSGLINSKGIAMADAILITLHNWSIETENVALSFDTTTSNTGLTAGAYTLVEQKLEREVLHLA